MLFVKDLYVFGNTVNVLNLFVKEFQAVNDWKPWLVIDDLAIG